MHSVALTIRKKDQGAGDTAPAVEQFSCRMHAFNVAVCFFSTSSCSFDVRVAVVFEGHEGARDECRAKVEKAPSKLKQAQFHCTHEFEAADSKDDIRNSATTSLRSLTSLLGTLPQTDWGTGMDLSLRWVQHRHMCCAPASLQGVFTGSAKSS